MSATLRPLAAWLALPLLTPAEEADLAARIQAGDMTARDELVARNSRLAVREAKRWYARLDFDDRVAIAVEALLKAAAHFRPIGYRFSTYAAPIIRQELAAASAAARPIRLPSDLARALSRLEHAERAFYQENAEPATDADLASALDWPAARVAQVRALPAVRASLNETVRAEAADDPGELGDLLPDDAAPGPEAVALAEAASAAAASAVREALAGMDAETALALRLRYGLNGTGYATCQDVAEAMDSTPARVYQLLRKAKRAVQNTPAARQAYHQAA